jgi:hypothetical protein
MYYYHNSTIPTITTHYFPGQLADVHPLRLLGPAAAPDHTQR